MKNDIETLLDNIEKHLAEHYKDYVEGAVETTKYGIYCDDLRLLSNYITNLKERIDKAVEYITSYEAISTIQGLDKIEQNKTLDEKTMIVMVDRCLEVHDKLLNILQGKDETN